MTVISNPNCVNKAGNTGIPECVIDPKEIVGAILIPASLVLTTTDIETTGLVSVLQTKSLLEALSERVYPIWNFEEIADNSEDIVKVTRGYGNTIVARDGKYNWAFTFSDGGIMFNKSLRKFNFAQDRKVLWVDKLNRIWGVDDGSEGMRGFALDYLHTKPLKINDGATPTTYMIEFGMSKASELNDDVVFVDTQEQLNETLKGILDVTLVEIATTATEWTILLKTLYGHVNLYGEFAADLAVAGAWLITKAGTPVVPAAVATDAVNFATKVTLTAPTGIHVAAMEDPTALAALGIGGTPEQGYEGANTLSHDFT